MKTLKLSLVATMVAGAMSSLSAAPLEDAIKDIDVSGFGRYRYDSSHDKIKTGNAYWKDNGKEKISNSFHRFTLDVNFKATLDDNFFSVIGLRYDTIDISGTGKNSANKGIANTHGGLSGINSTYGNSWGGSGDSLSVRQYYAGYKGIPDTTIIGGRQIIGAFFTDDVVGTGLKVLNNSVDGLTLAVMAFDNIEDDGDLASVKTDPNDSTSPYISQENLYGVAAIYSYEWFNAQAWYAYLQNVTNLWAVDLGANYAINDDFSVRGRVNVGGGHFTKGMHRGYNQGKGSTLANSIIVGVNLGLTYDWLSLDAGYITYGKKDKTGALTLEDEGKYIKSGEYVLDYTDFTGKHDVWFGKIGFKYDAYSLGLDYTHDRAKMTYYKEIINAYTIRAGYKYSDKLNFTAWWELKNEKRDFIAPSTRTDDIKVDYNRFRFDARYNF